MNKSSLVPYSWEEIEHQVRSAILCLFDQLRYLGPQSSELQALYLGISADQLDALSGDNRTQIAVSFPLDRHHLYALTKNAYRFAYQLDGWERATYEDHYMIDCGVLPGFPQADMDGEPSPFSAFHDFPLRRVFETFLARWNLYNPDYAGGLSVRELALLSNMTVPAVRTSLSKEGIKLDLASTRGDGSRRDDDRSATLNIEDAMRWLEGRRGFVPNRAPKASPSETAITDIFADREITFDQALRKAMVALGKNPEQVADLASVSQTWLTDLAAGSPANIDLKALRSLARKLRVSEALFVSRGVEHLIGLETTSDTDDIL